MIVQITITILVTEKYGLLSNLAFILLLFLFALSFISVINRFISSLGSSTSCTVVLIPGKAKAISSPS